MRIASNQFHGTMTRALQQADSQVGSLLERIATGERLAVPSDDPVAAVRLSRLSREQSAIKQYQDNIGALRSRLQQNEALLGSLNSDLLDARDQLVWAADGANTPDDIQAMSSTLTSLRDSLLYTANSRDQEGRYMFSGTLSTTAPIAYDASQPAGSRYSWAGNGETQWVVVGNGVRQPANVSLTTMAGLLNKLDLAAATADTGPDVSAPAVRAVFAGALDGIDVELGKVSGLIARQGGAMNLLQTLGDNHADVSLANEEAKTEYGALDYADAAVRLDGYKSALEATQKSYAKVAGLSLFDVI
ncbi:flagellar hook-associated protein FlgL [Rubrivivax gelatinosus]|uniref:Lateral flagellar hook-associated protein 3 LfgL n=1 Tax=Rubrivivax gelatinosus (strain NBRC 100245 / IL144) TaxID=983917 RepID=I0HQP3_RUBGI|nr:flagellar hook-associated protein FlgL [Rubrivivax gelatinosus]MBG6081865.1 flagellar hook-associated protein 3 FlgL [Rubrivivax gelatinosus]BAL95330.1 lateral flagellar hook-associated protein 3 LfgL [Rubrivivax gelatinosus IL144]